MGINEPRTQTAISVFERLGYRISPYDCMGISIKGGHVIFDIAMVASEQRMIASEQRMIASEQRMATTEFAEPCNDYDANSLQMPKCVMTTVVIPIAGIEEAEMQAIQAISEARQADIEARPEISPLIEVGLGERTRFSPSYRVEGDEVVYTWEEIDANMPTIRAAFQKLIARGAQVKVRREPEYDAFPVEVRMPLSALEDAQVVTSAITAHHDRIAALLSATAARDYQPEAVEFFVGC